MSLYNSLSKYGSLLAHHMHVALGEHDGNRLLLITSIIYLTIEGKCNCKCNFKKDVLNICFLQKLKNT